MVNKNLFEVTDSKLTVEESNKLINASKYIYDITNKTKIKIPFECKYGKFNGDYIVFADLKNMAERVKRYVDKNKKNPAYVLVKPKTTSDNTVKIISPSKGKFLKLFESRLGSVTNIKQVTEKIRGLGYDGYNNAYEIAKQGKSQGSVIANFNRLGKKPMNCCDYTSIICTIAIEMGYEAQPVQIQCTGITHLIARVKGKEYKDWVYIDSAPMASKTSPYCSFGSVCWCASKGKPKDTVAISPKWFFNMYPDDLLK